MRRFSPIDWWRFVCSRAQCYKTTFDVKHNQADRETLADLAEFCRANKSTFDPDPRVHAVLEGRREVWLRIMANLNLSDEERFKFFSKGMSFDPRKVEE